MKPLTPTEKAKRSRDTKRYDVAAVLDKPSSERILRPLPAQVTLHGATGEPWVLSLPPPRPGRA